MADHSERWRSTFTQVELREMWTYTDGALTAKAYRWPGETGRAGSWVLVGQETSNVQGVVNQRLARADGLQAEPDPTLGGAVNVVRPTLADAGRRDAAQRAIADQRAGFETFVAKRGLTARSLAIGSALGTPHAR